MIHLLDVNRKFLFLILSLLLYFPLKGQEKTKVVHVFVALCDNESQGIAPVPARIGNGDDPYNNLYWGCGYGIKTFFRRSPNWQLVASRKQIKDQPEVLERLIFKHRRKDAYLVADAYRGREIKTSIDDFLDGIHGVKGQTLSVNGKVLSLGGYADLLAYIGHNGLMEFSLSSIRPKNIYKKREGVILACAAKDYFDEHFKLSGAHPLLWTTDLMAPEAYTLEAVVEEWLQPSYTSGSIRRVAASTYNYYQKCGLEAAERLFQSGW